MPLGTKVNLGPRKVLLDGVAAPLKRGTAPFPVFGPRPLWPSGWRDEDATGTEIDLGPGHIALDGDPASPLPKEHAPL